MASNKMYEQRGDRLGGVQGRLLAYAETFLVVSEEDTQHKSK